MSQPLLPWDSPEDANYPQLVWRSKLDDIYLIEVRHTNGCGGELFVFDQNNNDQEIFSMDVDLLYGAILGPDVDDVQEWQEKVLDFIDNTYNKQ